MSILTVPVIADTIAGFMGSFKPRPAKGPLGFPEIPGQTTEKLVPTRHRDVACTLYSPQTRSAHGHGLYINFHGGGFVIPGRRQDDPWCRYVAHFADAYVLNVEYSTAPGARFPIAVEQAYDVTAWASGPDHAWDSAKVAVGGQSAGGNLAAAVAYLSLQAGSPNLVLQVLHYAPLDLVTDIRDKPSPLKRTVLKPWMRDVFDTAYVPRPSDRQDPLISPAWEGNTEDLTGIAPAVVATCANDRLRVDGEKYAARLDASGALAAHIEIVDADHGYNLLTTRAAAERGYRALVPLIRDRLNS